MKLVVFLAGFESTHGHQRGMVYLFLWGAPPPKLVVDTNNSFLSSCVFGHFVWTGPSGRLKSLWSVPWLVRGYQSRRNSGSPLMSVLWGLSPHRCDSFVHLVRGQKSKGKGWNA